MTPDSTRRFKLTVQYDGTYFLGWQLQPQGRTVQGDMEWVLERLTGTRHPVVAAGRTDSGVHARGQVVAVALPQRWGPAELRKAMNACLPDDIWIASVEEVPWEFHPRFSATARSYEYLLGLSEEAFSPFHRPWCWPLVRGVDVDSLHQAAALLPGDRSFLAFAKVGQEHRGDRCRVTHAAWVPWPGLGLSFRITANRFLHHMVRYLVGTMVEIGWGRRPLGDMVQLLADPDTPLTTSPPAPPEGLILTEVHYPEPASGLD